MLNSIFVIIGTIIGAGFASGREILVFFNLYGVWGFLGILISQSIIAVITYKSFSLIINKNISSYTDFINSLFPKSSFINLVLCNIINIFLLISFIVMVAGFSAYFAQEFNLPYVFGGILISVLSFITFLRNIDGVVSINKFLVPCLIIIVLLLGLKNINCFVDFTNISINFNVFFIIKSILYASYNLVILIPVLIGLKKYVKNIQSAKVVAIGASLFLFLMSCILFFLVNFYYNDVANLELPTIYIASKLGYFYRYVCGLLILGAIFTTAISNGYGFLENLCISNKPKYRFISFLMCIVAIFLSNIGFSTLLNFLYPILGIFRNCSNYIANSKN